MENNCTLLTVFLLRYISLVEYFLSEGKYLVYRATMPFWEWNREVLLEKEQICWRKSTVWLLGNHHVERATFVNRDTTFLPSAFWNEGQIEELCPGSGFSKVTRLSILFPERLVTLWWNQNLQKKESKVFWSSVDSTTFSFVESDGCRKLKCYTLRGHSCLR